MRSQKCTSQSCQSPAISRPLCLNARTRCHTTTQTLRCAARSKTIRRSPYQAWTTVPTSEPGFMSSFTMRSQGSRTGSQAEMTEL